MFIFKKLKRIFLIFSVALSLTACVNSEIRDRNKAQTDTVTALNELITPITQDTSSIDTLSQTQKAQTKLTVLVLPPFDKMANAGMSPDIQEYLETEISKDTTLTLIRFPYKQLMNVPYHHVFDKKYCKPILDKVKADIIIMSKLDNLLRPGQMNADRWNFQIKIYTTSTDIQTLSSVTGNNIGGDSIKTLLADRHHKLMTEIKNKR